jgi:L-aminopeptidase/D-esterase-like protein
MRMPVLRVGAIVAVTLLVVSAMTTRRTSAQSANRTLTAVPGIRVGHHTLAERPTGCTVIVPEHGAVAGVDVRGWAPGTRETALLAPVNSNQQIHAIVLSGGSAFGLDAASGVMRYLDERNVGLKLGANGAINVPIVPGAVLIDLWVGGKPQIRPTADCGYEAARAATREAVAEGNVGAGAGATVGKFAGRDRAMKGGLGSAAITLPNGIVIAALVAVNAFGDVIDPATGKVIAGVRTPDGAGLADARTLLRSGWTRAATPAKSGGGGAGAGEGENTTLGVIATNATLTKAAATKVAQMAHDGYARAIAPIHTPVDGDTIFALATGDLPSDVPNDEVGRIGALAADVMAEAIVRAVRQATSLPGIPAARDLR